jgi:hypothetical protein
MSQEEVKPPEEDTSPKPQAPTPVALRFVRYVLGFGVWVAIGLAPFLGTVKVPLFESLLSLYPTSLHWVIPVSGLLMGAIGMAVEHAAGKRTAARTLDRWFRRGLGIFAVSLVLLILLYPVLVTRVPYHGEQIASFVTGPSVPATLPSSCGCEPGGSRAGCIQDISFDPVKIETCFGSGQVLLSGQVLVLLYLLLTGSLAACGGVLVLQAERRRKKAVG